MGRPNLGAADDPTCASRPAGVLESQLRLSDYTPYVRAGSAVWCVMAVCVCVYGEYIGLCVGACSPRRDARTSGLEQRGRGARSTRDRGRVWCAPRAMRT